MTTAASAQRVRRIASPSLHPDVIFGPVAEPWLQFAARGEGSLAAPTGPTEGTRRLAAEPCSRRLAPVSTKGARMASQTRVAFVGSGGIADAHLSGLSK